MGGKSSKPSGTTTTTQVADPWEEQQPYLADVMSEAQNLYRQGGAQYFPGTTLAAPSSYETDALGAIGDLRGTELPGVAKSFNQSLLEGEYLDQNPATDVFTDLSGTGSDVYGALSPYLSGERLEAGNPNLEGLKDSVMASVVPDIQDSFISGGMLSNPEAARATSAGATAAMAPYLFDQYNIDQTNQLRAAESLGETQLGAGKGLSDIWQGGTTDMLKGLALSPETTKGLYDPLENLLDAGGILRGYEQEDIDDAIARWNYEEILPYENLNSYLGGVTGSYGGTTTKTDPYYKSRTGGALSGALGGAAAGSTIGGPWGGAIGGGLGLLSSLFDW